MRVWVTRAEPGAARTAERLRACAAEPLVAPLLTLRALAFDPAPLHTAATLAFTSPNAPALTAGLDPRRELPVLAVGDATASAARAAGYSDIRSAAGDVAALTALIALVRPREPILHAGAAEPAGDLVGVLRAAGLRAEALAIYDMDEAETLPAASAEADAVLLHSPRAARVLARLADARLRALPAACLSEAVAEPLRAAGFSDLLVAPAPTDAALLAALGFPPPRP